MSVKVPPVSAAMCSSDPDSVWGSGVTGAPESKGRDYMSSTVSEISRRPGEFCAPYLPWSRNWKTSELNRSGSSSYQAPETSSMTRTVACGIRSAVWARR